MVRHVRPKSTKAELTRTLSLPSSGLLSGAGRLPPATRFGGMGRSVATASAASFFLARSPPRAAPTSIRSRQAARLRGCEAASSRQLVSDINRYNSGHASWQPTPHPEHHGAVFVAMKFLYREDAL